MIVFTPLIFGIMILRFKKMALEKGATWLQFTTDRIVNINPKHFIMLTRPKIDLEDIAEGVRHNYTDMIAKGLFDEELEQQMQKEIEKATERKIERNINLPHPTIFIGNVLEVKHSNGESTIKLSITPETAIYMIKSNQDLYHMVFDLGQYPTYLSGRYDELTVEECNKVLKIKDEFIRENPESEEVYDSFNPLISFIQSQNAFAKRVDEYKRPKFKYKDKVIYA